jgi:hypothetical protein
MTNNIELQPPVKKPTLWFAGGAGGNWLNYMIWCGLNQKNIIGKHVEFSNQNLKAQLPVFFKIVKHSDYDCHTDAVLGSYRSLLNFYINVATKNPSWTEAHPSGYILMQDHEWNYNLDYCDIFLDPDKFVKSVNQLTELNLSMDHYVECAFDQYWKSCVWVDMTKQELFKTQWITDSVDWCLNNRTNKSDSLAQRTEQAWTEIEAITFVWKKSQ